MSRSKEYRISLLAIVLAAIAVSGLQPIAALATYVLLLYLPGDIVVRAFSVGRAWTGVAARLWRLCLSFCFTPLLLDPIWRVTNNGATLVFAVGVSLALLNLAASWISPYKRPDETHPLRLCDRSSTAIALLALATLTIVATLGPYWPRTAHGAEAPSLIHDFIKHHAVLFSLEHYPLPLRNPFDASASSDAVYYYHYFYLIPATVRATTPTMSIEFAFGAQAALLGLALAGAAFLFVKRHTRSDASATLAALLTTAVGGFDIVALIWQRSPAITLDTWNDTLVRIHNLLTQMAWTPQNLQGALIGLVTACLLVELGPWHRGWLLLGPLLGANLVGSTIWVAAAFLPGVALFVIIELARDTSAIWRDRGRRLAGAGFVAAGILALSLPQLLGYAEVSRRHGRGLTFEWPYSTTAFLGRWAPAGPLANLLDLPWWLLIELGPLALFPCLLSAATWRSALSSPGYRFLIASAVASLVGFVTARSHFEYNDFGQKVIFATQIAGVVFAALLVRDAAQINWLNPLSWRFARDASGLGSPLLTSIAIGALLLGSPVGLFQAPLAAIRRHLPPEGRFNALVGATTITAQHEADAWRFVRERTPRDAVLQTFSGEERVPFVQIGERQMGVMVLERDTEVFQPIDAVAHEQRLMNLTTAFANDTTAAELANTLRSLRVTHIFVGEIERQEWKHWDLLDDADSFERVFDSTAARVYRVK